MEVADEQRYARDLLNDPWIKFVDRTFVLWVVLGLAAAFGLGVALTGTVSGGLKGLLWGGAARIFFVHHATFSINSVCHFFGRRDYDTGDESRNVPWLAIPTWGESWHNNHHAFPTSYRHGLKRWQIDPSAAMIRTMEALGLAWDVVRVDPDAGAGKARDLTSSVGAWRSRTPAPPAPRARDRAPGAAVHRPLLGRHEWCAPPPTARPPSRSIRRARSPMSCARPASSASAAPTSIGLIDVDDLDGALRVVDTFEAPSLGPATIARLGVALVRACGLVRPPRPPAAELRLRGERHTLGRDRAAVRHHYNVGNDFFALFLDAR